MARIRFTLGDSAVWHEVVLENYNLSLSEVKDANDLSYIIKKELENINTITTKKVEVYDESGRLLARTSDIVEFSKFEYMKDK